MKDTLDDMIRASCSIHTELIEMGLPVEQALRIAFGTEFTNTAIEIVSILNLNSNQKEQDENISTILLGKLIP